MVYVHIDSFYIFTMNGTRAIFNFVGLQMESDQFFFCHVTKTILRLLPNGS